MLFGGGNSGVNNSGGVRLVFIVVGGNNHFTLQGMKNDK